MSKKEHRLIGVVLPSLGLRDGDILRGIRAYASPDRHWALHVVGDEPVAVKGLRPWKPDGIIGVIRDRRVGNTIAALRKPVVNVSNSMSPAQSRFVRVASDDVDVGATAARYFLRLGFSKFALFDEPGYWWSECRKTGFRDEVTRAGFSCRIYGDEVSPPRSAHPMAALTDPEPIMSWARSLTRPAALFVVNDYRARELLELFRAAGIHVPSDLAVVGVENEPIICEVAFPPLSSVATEPKRIGYEAAAVLDQLLHGQAVTPRFRFLRPTGVVSRLSSDLLATEDSDVQSAVRFIRGRTFECMGVAQVMEHVAISRRQLERRFMAALGRTVLEEIHLARIDRAKRMLVDTDLPMPALAVRCGFSNSQRFNAAFRRHTGMTPTGYRRQFRLGA